MTQHRWWWRKRWLYLGYTELRYQKSTDDPTIIDRFAVHFYIREDDLAKRRVSYGQRSKYTVETHPFFEKSIVSWLEGESLYRPVLEPSGQLKQLVKAQHGLEWLGDKWVKPAPKPFVEGNVIKFEGVKR